MSATRMWMAGLVVSFGGFDISAGAWAAVAEAGNKPLYIEEIIITARRVDEQAVSVPLSVSAFNSEALGALGVGDIHGLADFVVNFSMNPSNGRQAERPTIRGQSNILGAPNAAFFLDGNYVNAESSIATQLFDAVERVEVIRGPQAALFGRSTLSGAVNYVLRDPGDSFDVRSQVSYGSYDSYSASVVASGPLIEGRLLGLLALGTRFDGGEWKNTLAPLAPSPLFPGAPTRGDRSTFGDQRTDNYFARLLYLGEMSEIRLSAFYTEADDSHAPAFFLGANDLNCQMPVAGTATELSRGYACGKVDVSGRSMEANIPDIEEGLSFGPFSGPGASPGNERDALRLAADLDFDLDDWQLLTKFSYSDQTHVLAEDSDHTGTRPSLFFFNGTVISKRTEDRAAEVRLVSPVEGRVRGTLGAYSYQQRHTDQRRGFYQDFGAIDEPSRIRNSAVFGRLSVDVDDRLTMDLDLRYARDRISLGEGISHSFESVTPRIAADYRLNDSEMVYATIAKGTKPGGFNETYYASATHPDALSEAEMNGRAYVEEEQAWTYEVGYKGRLLDNRLHLEAAAFYIDWTDQQITSIAEVLQQDLTVRAVPILVNLGESEILGLELKASFDLSERLQVGGSYGLADSEIRVGNDPVDDAALFGFDDPTLAGGGNLKGRTLPNAPKHSATGYVRYEAPLKGDLQGFARVDATYESKKYAQVHNLLHTGDRFKVNVRLGIFEEDWGLEAYGENVFGDETPVTITRYVDFVSPSGPNGRWRGFIVTPERGARWGVVWRQRF